MRKMLVVLILMGGYRGLDAQGSVTPTCPTMELGIVADRPDGSTRTFPAGPRGAVVLTGKPLFTIDDFTDANVSVTEGQIVLNELADSINHKVGGCRETVR